MTNDLRAGLAALGREERDAAPQLPVAALASRARRRRAVRVAITSTAAAVAVGAIAVAAAGLPLRTTPPAATPTPSPTPSPTQTAAAWPTAITLDGAVPGCGDPMPAVVSPEGEPELRLDVALPAPSARAGEQIQATVTLTGRSEPGLWVGSPSVLLVQDGVVVGRERADDSRDGVRYGPLDGSLTWSWPGAQVMDLIVCGTAGRGAVGLAAGEYEVYVTESLFLGGPSGVPDEESAITVVSDPYPLTVEAAFDPHPALEDLIISPAGLGPLTVGLPPETNPGAAMIAFDEDYCVELNGGTWDEAAWGPPGEWVPAGYPAVPEFWGTGSETRDPFRVAARETVARIDIISPLLRTSRGIGLGSTLTELRDAHPEVVEQTVAVDWSRAWVIQGPEGTLLFETADDLDGYMPELTEETVVSIRITAPGEDFPRHTWGSGDVVGNCGLS